MPSSVLWANKSPLREHKLSTDRGAQGDGHKLKSKSSIFKFLQLVFYKILLSTAVN